MIVATARLLPAGEAPFAEPRTRGMPGRGLTYQRKVGAALRAEGLTVVSGQWIEWWDGAGRRRCAQPDHIVVGGTGGGGAAAAAVRPWIIECKLKRNDVDAVAQLQRYAAILAALGRPAGGLCQAVAWLGAGPRPALLWRGGFAGLIASSNGDPGPWLWHTMV